ncbi:MAG: hypothetical protein AAFR44_01945 [Pseudomonadota bacterium]
MSKGDKRRGNREAKKPKQVKQKPAVTADFFRGTTLGSTAGKKKP